MSGGDHTSTPVETQQTWEGLTLGMSRTFGPWPHPMLLDGGGTWPHSPHAFEDYTRTNDGRLLEATEVSPPLSRGKSFAFLPRPLGARNVIRGAPSRPAR